MKMAHVQLSCYPLWFSLTACFSNGGEISSRSKLSCSKHFCPVYVASNLQLTLFMFCSVDRLSALPVAALCVYCECTNMLLFYCHTTLTETSFGKLKTCFCIFLTDLHRTVGRHWQSPWAVWWGECVPSFRTRRTGHVHYWKNASYKIIK